VSPTGIKTWRKVSSGIRVFYPCIEAVCKHAVPS
jgi:hypothetical protein